MPIVTGPPAGIVGSPFVSRTGGPICPSPHASSAASAGAASADLARIARRVRQPWQGIAVLASQWCSQADERGVPLHVVLFLEQLVEIHRERVTVGAFAHGEPVESSCRAPLDERSVGAVLRVVLRALELMLVIVP